MSKKNATPADIEKPAPVPDPVPVESPAPIVEAEKLADPVPVDTNAPLEIGEDAILGDDDVIDIPTADTGETQEIKSSVVWNCPICAKDFPMRSYMLRHMRKGHRDHPRLEELIAAVPEGTRGRPTGSTVNRPPPDFTEMAAGLANPVDYKGMSNMLFETSTGLLVMTFGPEWHPRPSPNPNVPDEKIVMVGAIENYLRAKDVKDIPPGLMLTMVCIAYAAPRFRAPETSRKLGLTWHWIKFKFGNFFRRKKVDLSVVKAEHD